MNHLLSRCSLTLAVLLGSLAGNISQATELECRANGDVRYVRLEYPGQEHLCEVSTTNQNQERRVSWYANNDSTFCSVKFAELTRKYTDKWGFSCKPWPSRTNIDELSTAARQLLDRFVKQQRTLANEQDPPELLRAVRAFSLKDSAGPTLVAQMFLMNGDNDSEDRSWHLSTDPAGQTVKAHSLPRLISLIKPAPVDAKLNSAILEKVSPDNQIVINTTLYTAMTPREAPPDCYGQQSFSFSDDGTLVAAGEHAYQCSP